MSEKTFLFCSPLALQKPFLRVAEIVTREHGLSGHVLAPEEFRVTTVQHPSGRLSRDDFDASSTPLTVHSLPTRKGDLGRFGFKKRALRSLLRELDPDYVWLHAEFWEGIATQFLWRYRFCRRPRIVAYVATNQLKERPPLVSARWPFLSRTRLAQVFLWPRLDGVCARAGKSTEWARHVRLPRRVPTVVNYLPVLGPGDAAEAGIAFPWEGDGAFTIGFAGLLDTQKGWRVLLAAV
ncbi:MAG: glycosyltransferase, partial [Candidatus Brocadiae bacterium]|nr:glycosyltransferase [Candidatus Brocadiia bacterium]